MQRTELVGSRNRFGSRQSTHQTRLADGGEAAAGRSRDVSQVPCPAESANLSPASPFQSLKGVRRTHINPTLATPLRATSKPKPGPPPPPEVGVISSRLSLASFALSCPKWYDVACGTNHISKCWSRGERGRAPCSSASSPEHGKMRGRVSVIPDQLRRALAVLKAGRRAHHPMNSKQG